AAFDAPQCRIYTSTRNLGDRYVSHPAPSPSLYIPIHFDSGTAELTPKEKQSLGRLADALNSQQLSEYRFEIAGHTDSRGSDNSNLTLSQRRARSVVSYLTEELGVPEKLLVPLGYGERCPAADNRTVEGRSKNRRVEVTKLDSNVSRR